MMSLKQQPTPQMPPPSAMTRDSAEATTETAAGDSIDLSALSLRHLAVREAKLISRTR